MRKPYYFVDRPGERGLEHFFSERRTLADFRRGPLGDYFDGLALTLKKNGYSAHHACGILRTCCLFNVFAIERGLATVSAVSVELIEPFLDERLRGFRTSRLSYSPRDDARSHLRHLFFYLEALKAITPPKPVQAVRPYNWVLDPYVAYLREEREVAPATLQRHVAHVTAFLEFLGRDVLRSRFKALDASRVEAQLKRHITGSKENVRALSSSLCMFLRYCATHGHTRADFSGLILRKRHYRHASLPRGIDDAALERLVAVIDRTTPNGARDYAIMLVLMAYGVRAISACRLVMEDLDWRQARIRFRAQKGGKEVLVPLLDAVAEAIIGWLRHRDPRTPHREVFLSAKAPHTPLASMAISGVVKHYMCKAGIHQPGRGAHSLRHSWAIRALEHDQPIKAIADALGHRYIDTTYIYAKADLKTLRQVAMPWPKG